jgi:hypothetical protein
MSMIEFRHRLSIENFEKYQSLLYDSGGTGEKPFVYEMKIARVVLMGRENYFGVLLVLT